MSVVTLRHEPVFPASRFNPRRVDVVGCGALGSRVAMSLAKLGLEDVHLWDFDTVAEHNIPNQLFGNGDVGKPKTVALSQLVCNATDTICTCHDKCDGTESLGSVVFMCVDSMKVRKELWEAQVRYQPFVHLLIESRMGADSGRVYAVRPCEPKHVELYEATLYGDEQAEVSACGSTISVGPTAELVSGFAVWQFMRWFRWSERLDAKDVEPENELVFATRQSLFMMTRKFE
jgi:molybdopterin/thiamine biosynthesis adenylyltransferase